MILEILSYRLSLREGGSFAADDEAISLPGKVGDCFCKERLGMTPGLVDFQNSFDDLHICTVLGMMGWCNITNEEIKRA